MLLLGKIFHQSDDLKILDACMRRDLLEGIARIDSNFGRFLQDLPVFGDHIEYA